MSVAVAAIAGAVVHQRGVDRPVGEGELFARDGADARARLEEMMPMYEPGEGIRHLRNQMDIEAVSLIDQNGVVVESTSTSLVGTTVTNQLLLFGLDSAGLTALARTIDTPIMVDGVVEWQPGDVLYQVFQPLASGGIVLDYDLSELFARRARPDGFDPTTVQLLGVATLLVLVGWGLLVGRSRVARRNHQVFVEAELLRRHSEQLETKNDELSIAHLAAEDALALAEEKIRIRADFVLMINHELRTPLTAMVTGAELLRTHQLTADERATLITDMAADGRRLESLISQMLEVAHIENRGLSLTFDAHSYSDICTSAANAHPQLSHVGGTETNPALLWTNESALLQLIGSLADNAVTHGAGSVELTCSDHQVIDPSVEVGTRPADPVYLAVTDDGPGIDPAFLPHIFDKFEKDSFSSGTGLGLYLAALMVEALEASLSVATSPAGTTMVVAVPTAARADVAEAA